MSKINLVKAIAYGLSALGAALLIAFGLTACNVTRTVTTTSQFYQKGDTTMTIQTKTVESYDASKKLY